MARTKKTEPEAITQKPITPPTLEQPPEVPNPIKEAPDTDTSNKETPFPYEATVNVTLAVLRKAPDGDLLSHKPVGTVRQGTKVTVTAIHDGYAQLKNGLWMKAEYLSR